MQKRAPVIVHKMQEPGGMEDGGLEGNRALLLALFACGLAQLAKIFTHWYATPRHKEGRWEVKKMLSSGGMPSSHSAAVVALTTAVGLSDGLTSNTFAIAMILSLIVMYDASGVRLHAGKQAQVLNRIITELPPEHPAVESRHEKLQDHLGHTPVQVYAGAALGFMVGVIGHESSWRTVYE